MLKNINCNEQIHNWWNLPGLSRNSSLLPSSYRYITKVKILSQTTPARSWIIIRQQHTSLLFFSKQLQNNKSEHHLKWMEFCPGSRIVPEVPVSPSGTPVPGIQYRLYLATEWASKELITIVISFCSYYWKNLLFPQQSPRIWV